MSILMGGGGGGGEGAYNPYEYEQRMALDRFRQLAMNQTYNIYGGMQGQISGAPLERMAPDKRLLMLSKT